MLFRGKVGQLRIRRILCDPFMWLPSTQPTPPSRRQHHHQQQPNRHHQPHCRHRPLQEHQPDPTRKLQRVQIDKMTGTELAWGKPDGTVALRGLCRVRQPVASIQVLPLCLQIPCRRLALWPQKCRHRRIRRIPGTSASPRIPVVSGHCPSSGARPRRANAGRWWAPRSTWRTAT